MGETLEVKVRVNSYPLEEYLNSILQELKTIKSGMAQDILRQDITHRAIWIEPSNNISKLIDIDLALELYDDDVWHIDLTLNPVNIHDKNAEIRKRFEEKAHFWEEDE